MWRCRFSLVLCKEVAWLGCQDTLYHINPKWGKRVLEYGGSFTWSKFFYDKSRVHKTLNTVYVPPRNITF